MKPLLNTSTCFKSFFLTVTCSTGFCRKGGLFFPEAQTRQIRVPETLRHILATSSHQHVLLTASLVLLELGGAGWKLQIEKRLAMGTWAPRSAPLPAPAMCYRSPGPQGHLRSTVPFPSLCSHPRTGAPKSSETHRPSSWEGGSNPEGSSVLETTSTGTGKSTSHSTGAHTSRSFGTSKFWRWMVELLQHKVTRVVAGSQGVRWLQAGDFHENPRDGGRDAAKLCPLQTCVSNKLCFASGKAEQKQVSCLNLVCKT